MRLEISSNPNLIALWKDEKTKSRIGRRESVVPAAVKRGFRPCNSPKLVALCSVLEPGKWEWKFENQVICQTPHKQNICLDQFCIQRTGRLGLANRSSPFNPFWLKPYFSSLHHVMLLGFLNLTANVANEARLMWLPEEPRLEKERVRFQHSPHPTPTHPSRPSPLPNPLITRVLKAKYFSKKVMYHLCPLPFTKVLI